MNNIVLSNSIHFDSLYASSIAIFNLILRLSHYTINCYYFNKISFVIPFFLIYDSFMNSFYFPFLNIYAFSNEIKYSEIYLKKLEALFSSLFFHLLHIYIYSFLFFHPLNIRFILFSINRIFSDKKRTFSPFIFLSHNKIKNLRIMRTIYHIIFYCFLSLSRIYFYRDKNRQNSTGRTMRIIISTEIIIARFNCNYHQKNAFAIPFSVI